MVRACGGNGDGLPAEGITDFSVLPLRINDENIRIRIGQIQADRLLLGKQGFARTGDTADKGVSVLQFCAVDRHQVLADGIVCKINPVPVADFLYPERHEHRKGFGRQGSADGKLRNAVRQNGIQPLQLLPPQDIHRAKVFSCTLADGVGVGIQLFLAFRCMAKRHQGRNHALIP